MRKLCVALFLMSIISFISKSQGTGNLLFGVGVDAFKTDYNQAFEKAQIGLELNYFLRRNFTVTGGADIWINGKNNFVIGMRWYPADFLIIRFRGLIGANDWQLALAIKNLFLKNSV